jgi:universal stress protein E
MQRFDNIVVGIDIAQLKRPDVPSFSPPIEEAIRQGLWLAHQTSGGLTFLSVLDVSEHSLDEPDHHAHATIISELERVALRVLDDLVLRAQQQGVDARRILRFGKGWVEMIRQVIEDEHDLAIVGTRDQTVRRLLFGSTAMKLLRKCPCAVWVTKPPTELKPGASRIAVASDLTAVSTLALEAGLRIGKLSGAVVHLVHSVDFPLDRWWASSLSDKPSEGYHASIQTRASELLQRQLAQVDVSGLPFPVERHIVEGLLNPDIAILDFVKHHQIDLLAMGTIGRGGLAGVFTGNTAERLLPQLPCSVLAVKPQDFLCPVT